MWKQTRVLIFINLFYDDTTRDLHLNSKTCGTKLQAFRNCKRISEVKTTENTLKQFSIIAKFKTVIEYNFRNSFFNIRLNFINPYLGSDKCWFTIFVFRFARKLKLVNLDFQ
ncbi:hypothetical protein V1478_002217 [Vespula squamosa]|uniref:Uncharacterized protein n=1 Tax=Vespula squamosa TaxID=30214 RepID=A0ABD2BW60_VESSQ